MKKAVAYTRVSTQNQVGQYGLDDQERSIKEYAEQHNIELVKWFSDEGISGSKGVEYRIGLARMMEHLEKNPDIEIVIIPELSRLARDLILQESVIWDIQKKKVSLISVKEGNVSDDVNSKDRKLIRQIIGAFNEYQRDMIRDRMAAGRIEKATQGEHAVGRIPYGYKSVKKGKRKALEKVDEEIELVQTIFDLRDNRGMPWRSIADYLNENGFKPKSWTPENDKKFYYTTVRNIYFNPKYKGIVQLNDGGKQVITENEDYRVV